MKVTKENYEVMKALVESLSKEISEFEMPVQVETAWPMTVYDLPKDRLLWWIEPDGTVTQNGKNTVSFPFREYATETDAKSAVAFSQLSRLVRYINGGWEPDWANDNERKYRIEFDGNGLEVEWEVRLSFYPVCLYFKNEADAQKSIKTHRQLWLDYCQR